MIKFDTAVHSYPFLLKTRAFFLDWPSVHSVEASGGYDFKKTKNTLESFENAIFMNSVSGTGNNPSYLLLKSMASKRITFLSQFCLTLFQTK